MKRKLSKRLEYRPSARIVDHASRKDRGFTYKPKLSQKHRPRQKPQRQFTRKELVHACLEEFHLGGSGIAALYASLLVRTLADLNPELGTYGRAVEEVLACGEARS